MQEGESQSSCSSPKKDTDETHDLATLSIGLLNRLDDTDSDGLTHVTDGETSERRVLGERLNAHGLGGTAKVKVSGGTTERIMEAS